LIQTILKGVTVREVKVEVVDHKTYPGNKTSRNIRLKEFEMIYPGERPRRLDYIFTHRKPLLIPEKQATFLIRKYGKVIEIMGAEKIKLNADDKAMYNVDTMKRPALINLAARMDVDGAIRMKNEVLKEAIKKAILGGVVPLSQSEYEIRKEERAK